MSDDIFTLNLGDVYTGVFNKDEGQPKKLLERIGKTNDFILRIDNSLMEKWQTCQRAWFYYAVKGREKPGSPALNFGQACHHGWEVLGRGGVLGQAKAAVTEHLIKNPQPPEEYRSVDYACEVMEKYTEKYQASTCSVYEHNGQPMVEVPFSINVGAVEVGRELAFSWRELVGEDSYLPVFVDQLHFFWTGKIDRIVSFDGDLWVLDHKTSSMGGPTFFADFELAQQTVGYVWAAEYILDRPIKGFILDAAFVRRKTKTGKGLEFERSFYTYEPWKLDEWLKDVKSQAGSCIDQLVNGYFPKKTKWCMGKYGACPYHEVCTLDPGQREQLLFSSNYGNVTWSPLNK